MLPVMPGTWGSLAALPCAWAIRSLCGAAGLAIAAAIAIAVGCWAAGTIAKTSGVKDPGAIVIDEVAAQWLVLLPVPLEPLSYAAAFLLFRIFPGADPVTLLAGRGATPERSQAFGSAPTDRRYAIVSAWAVGSQWLASAA